MTMHERPDELLAIGAALAPFWEPPKRKAL
jgi:hypothetical protein